MNDIISIYHIICGQIKERFSKNIISLIVGFLVVLLMRSLLAIMDTIFIQDEFPIQRIVFILSTALLIMGLEIGYTKFVFKIIDNHNHNISSIFNYFHFLKKYVLGLILYYFSLTILFLPFLLYLLLKYELEFFELLINSINDPYFQELVSTYFNFNELFLIFLVCLIPTIYFAIRLSFWSYFVIDKEDNALESIKKSWLLTKNKSFEICVFGMLLLFFNLLGALLLVGICFTVPISYLFFCLYFRYLLSQ